MAEAAILQWLADRDALLRGLTHALSNRIGTVSAVAGMLTPGAAIPEPVADVLQGEATRLDDVLALYRLLPLDRGAAPEPLHLPDLAPQVIALVAYHPDQRDGGEPDATACVVDADPGAPPVFAPHSALAHALAVLLVAARRGAADGVARLAWRADGDQVTLTVKEAGGVVHAAAWLLGDAAVTRAVDGAAVVALPTLAAARRGGGKASDRGG